MTDPRTPDDDRLEAQLRRRVGHASLGNEERERIVQAVVQSTAARGWRRPWRMVLAPLTVVVVLVAVVAGLPVLLPGGPNASKPPTAAPAPVESAVASGSAEQGARVLLDVELRQLVAQVRAGNMQPTVVANALFEHDPGVFHDQSDCGPSGGCLVGTYADATGTVVPVYSDATFRDAWGSPFMSFVSAEFGGTFALHLSADGIDVLGVDTPTDGGNLLWPASADGVKPAESGQVGNVVAVDGWLTLTSFPCAPLPGPTPPPDSPFDPCGNSWVSDHSLGAITSTPVYAIRVQRSAYDTFAPDHPAADQQQVSQRATYLIKLIHDPRAVCGPLDCLGWQMVGRLTTTGLPDVNATPLATQPAGPPASPVTLKPLGPVELMSAIGSAPAGGSGPGDVIANVTIDTSVKPAPTARECQDPPVNCTVIGTIDYLGPREGVVLGRDDLLSPPALPDAPAAVALHVGPTGLLEYLGMVLPDASTYAWTVPDALAAEQTLPVDHVIAVHGWLVGTVGFSCGPAPDASVPPVAPFDCAIHDYITPDSEQVMFPYGGNGAEGKAPAVGLTVQEGAYSQFAPDPQPTDTVGVQPREGTYLVQAVVNHSTWGGLGAHGWLVVGRVDTDASGIVTPPPAPTPTPQNPPGQEPIGRSAAEAEALIGANRSFWTGRTLVVDGSVTPGTPVRCAGPEPCAIGTLDGTTEKVVASPATMPFVVPPQNGGMIGPMAFTVRADSFEYLGQVGVANDNGIVFQPTDAANPDMLNGRPGRLLIVAGWLVDSGPIPCPAPLPGLATPPPGTPFEACPWAWISASDAPVWTRGSGGSGTMHVPADGVRVQWAAYHDFAKDPQTATDGTGDVPRLGFYVLRLVSDPRPGADPATGWQVVARIDP